MQEQLIKWLNTLKGQTISRLAPTPSGFLHLGNGMNLAITWALSRATGGKLILRIDDADRSRLKPIYVEQLFVDLDYLGLDWDEGPESPADLEPWSQRNRNENYLDLLNILSKEIYACECSRSQIKEINPDGRYPGTCRERGLPNLKGKTATRWRTPSDLVEWEDGFLGKVQSRPNSAGDVILWRKDDYPAYHLCSLSDDIQWQVNLIVRGEDLKDSTGVQLALARSISAESFQKIAFFHHGLIKEKDGRKMSKSEGGTSLRGIAVAGTAPALIFQSAAFQMGLTSDPQDQQFQTSSDLLNATKSLIG